MASVSAFPSCGPCGAKASRTSSAVVADSNAALTCDHLSAGMVVDTKPTAGDSPRFRR